MGEATVVREGKSYKEIFVTPSGLQNGLEEVLIVIEGVHVPIPEARPRSQPVHLQEPPPAESSDSSTTDSPTTDAAPAQAPAQPPAQSGPLTTDADRLVDQYRKIGEAEKHVYGRSAGGAPNFNINLNPQPLTQRPQPPDRSPPESARLRRLHRRSAKNPAVKRP